MRTYILLSQAALVPALSMASPALAQNGPDAVAAEAGPTDRSEANGAGLQDIVVTAQRRAQNLQDVPIAVSAVSGAALEATGAKTVTDIGTVVPSVLITQSGSSVLPFVRGIGNSGVGPGNDPSVAVYVDGVYQASPNGLLFSFNNVNRVEVLKGPQGTLFGRNATGGLIHVISKDPTTEFGLNASVGVATYETVNGNFYLTAGSDRLAFDVAAVYSKQFNGWGTNLFTPSQAGTVLVSGVPVPVPDVASHEVGVNEELGLRFRVKFEATDRLTARLSGIYTFNRGDQGKYRTSLPGQLHSVNNVIFTPPAGFYDYNSDVDWMARTRTYQGSLQLDYDLDFATIKSISAYYDNEAISSTPSETTPLVSQNNVIVGIGARQTTQEITLSSNSSSNLQWVLGGFYLHAKSRNLPTQFNRGNIEGSFNIFGAQVTDSLSGFGQATIPLFSDDTHLTVGMRYTRDKLSASGYSIGTRTSAMTPTTPFSSNLVFGTIFNRVGKQSDVQSSFTYRVGLDHKIADDVMVYGSISTGFKSGVYNVFTGLCVRAGTPDCLLPSAPVRPEKLTAYEVGLKSELFDRKLRLNASGFYYDYKDLQVQVVTTLIGGGGSAQVLQNAASAKVYGAELEALLSATNRLTLSGQLAILHTEYTDFPNATVAVRGPGNINGVNVTLPNVKGNQLSRAPRFTASVSADYRAPVGSSELRLNATYYHNDGFFFEPSNRLRQKPYNLLNLSAELRPAQNWIYARIWAKNVFNEKYYLNQQASTNGDQGSPAAPRTLGITLGFELR